ncbi:MAG TPA: hypothetical protein VEQ10_05610, partial [Vicinamibacteria bacterium]|nr:hypothetical protein [Vicinamibacteria bacterium]
MPPPVLLAYATSALALSATLLWLGQRRGPAELAGWLAAYAAVAVIWCRARDQGPLGAGALA